MPVITYPIQRSVCKIIGRRKYWYYEYEDAPVDVNDAVAAFLKDSDKKLKSNSKFYVDYQVFEYAVKTTPEFLLRLKPCGARGKAVAFCPVRAVKGVATRKEFLNGAYTKNFSSGFLSRPAQPVSAFFISALMLPRILRPPRKPRLSGAASPQCH